MWGHVRCPVFWHLLRLLRLFRLLPFLRLIIISLLPSHILAGS
jgi:hypothetical protein